MDNQPQLIRRPQRWDVPFDSQSTGVPVDELLQCEPFSLMSEAGFSERTPLRGILANDCRVVPVERGDIVMRQGEYGGSVFLVLSGEFSATLRQLPPEILGRSRTETKSAWSLWRQLGNSRVPAERRRLARLAGGLVAHRDIEGVTRTFVQDIPAVFLGPHSQSFGSGQLFGEVSAMSRSPRTATVIAMGTGKLLEIRWQGFRDLLQSAPELRAHVNQSYRREALQSQLRETPLLKNLDESHLQRLVQGTEFHTFGKMQWTGDYRSILKEDIAARIQREPLIAGQGDYPNGLWIIRNGFGRVTRRQGIGEQTIEYLGKGRIFGLRELSHNFQTGEQRPWQLSLRAVGYVDTLLIPTPLVEEVILPRLKKAQRPSPLPGVSRGGDSGSRRLQKRASGLSTKLLENLVEQRLINGTEAMVIDLSRCTRCDDCVRACATAHDNNPRFVRDGTVIDGLMIAQACMHCVDPVCMIGCPTGAIAREESTGVITINEQTCIGCQTCANSCPYQNIKMVEVRDEQGQPLLDQQTQLPLVQATKCDLCIEQVGGPACQRACPHDALIRIDLTTPQPLTDWLVGGQ